MRHKIVTTLRMSLSLLMLRRGPLTEEDDGTEEDGDERPSAEARSAAQGLRVALLSPVAVARAHAHRQRAGAALHGVVAVGDDHRDGVDALLLPAVAGAPRQQPRRVVWLGNRQPFS